MDRLLDCIIVAESLPLCVNRIHTSSWKDSLFDKPLPVDLVFVLFRRVFLGHFEYLDELSNCEPSSLTRKSFYLFFLPGYSGLWHIDFGDYEAINRQPLLFLDHFCNPLKWDDVSGLIVVQIEFFITLLFENLDSKAFDQIWDIATILVDKFHVALGHFWHVDYVGYQSENCNIFCKKPIIIKLLRLRGRIQLKFIAARLV